MRFEENVPENRPCTPEEFKHNALLNLKSSGILATTKVRFKPVISKQAVYGSLAAGAVFARQRRFIE
jgi:hypothetical protein